MTGRDVTPPSGDGHAAGTTPDRDIETGGATDDDATGGATDSDTGADVEVAIVGAGPVGLVLGILLAQRGRSVALLEQWPSPYPLPRAVHIDHEVARVLQSCGIGPELRTFTEPAGIYEWRNGAGTTLLRFGHDGAGPSGWPPSSMFSQPELEAVLQRRAGELPSLRVLRGLRVRSLDQVDGRVVLGHVAVAPGPDGGLIERTGEVGTLGAGHVVGCDGANSTVRDLTGVGMDDHGFFHDWLIVDVVPGEPMVFDPPNLQVCDPRRPTTLVSGGPGRRRWEFMRLPDESVEDLHREDRAWELLEPWGVHRGNASLERHAVYTFQARVAERWREGRVLLAGDAAHQMPPFAGQGLCAGVRDAANLAWKLDLVTSGRADPDLLASYDGERRPSASAAIALSMELGKVICVPDPAEAAARDEAMAAAFDGGTTEVPPLPGIDGGVTDAASPLAGTLFPQATVDGHPADDVHGAGWRLVTVEEAGTGPAADLVDWFAGIGGAVIDLTAVDHDLGPWFSAAGVGWALQRPDFHLFGTAGDRDGAERLLERLRSMLSPPAPPSGTAPARSSGAGR